ncbi:unnamed protein product [Meganyctiphanes norvegica]|uniref:CRK SH3-binding GNRP n=1 Tax=Meganyctiphanes norvegica TaxID=48144 RepID=A0AAV2QQL5_MEGNR
MNLTIVMVNYVVVRQEFSAVPEWVKRWHSTEVLASLYGQEPDPLQRCLLHTFHRLPDTPKSSKRCLASRARSFKEDLLKFTGMKHTGPRGKIVKVEGRGGNETLQNKVAQVWRALSFYQSVVEKTIPDMLPGSATVVLEMILHLNAALKPCFANQDSSEVASVVVRVNHSLAELVRWSDQLQLHGEDTHHTATVQEVCRNVREAVENLVALAADKENLDLDTTCESVDNNNSITSHKSTPDYSDRIVETNNTNNHRNSLPEIKSLTPTEAKKFMTGDNPKKLTHSLSSDSIINNTEEESPPPKPPMLRHPSFGSCGDVAPPLPPKKNSRGKNNSSPENGMGSPVTHSTPISSGEWGTAMRHTRTVTGGDWGANTGTRHSAGSSTLASHDESLDQVSPASSLDSMNHSHDDLIMNHPTMGTYSGDFVRALQSNCLQQYAQQRVTHPIINYPEQFYADSELSSLQSMDSGSTSSGYQSISSQTYTSLGHSSSSTTIQESHRQQSQAIFRVQETTSSSSQVDSNTMTLTVPPPLPEKRGTRQVRKPIDRIPSQYDNVHDIIGIGRPSGALSEDTTDGEHVELRRQRVQNYSSASSSMWASGAIYSNGTVERRHKSGGDPSPELPPKKTSSGPGHLINSNSSSSSSVSSGISCTSSSSPGGGGSVLHVAHHRREVYSEHSYTQGDGNPPPLPPKKKHGIAEYMACIGPYGEPNINEIVRHSDYMVQYYDSDWSTDRFGTPWETSRYASVIEGMEHLRIHPPALPPKQKLRSIEAPPTKPALTAAPQRLPLTYKNIQSTASDNNTHLPVVPVETVSIAVSSQHKQEELEPEEEVEEEETLLDLLDVREFLVVKKETDDGPEIKGGSPDALVVHASKANKNDFLYQEAFLTTYRTFVEPPELVTKLLYRYHKFTRCTSDMDKQKASRNAFSLLVRVVDDLTVSDLTKDVLATLTDFEYELLCCGDLLLARALRRKIVEKLEARKRYLAPRENLTTLGVSTKQASLLDFKSHDIAEQMTLLDAELFQIMEIPEVLTWSREQSEEKSPNLTTFTEHFNKMSYWARSRILDQEDARDREKYVMKFIKIMKHLRKVNNFNSYLAILSALDSAPVRRLEWQRNIVDGLKEYCALIDSSSSFRAYRQALAETTPPCIPYIGLILQDLTFVHIGNPDLSPDKTVNFSKRWQLFNILDNMKRFKKCQYQFKKNEKIIEFFNNFDDHLQEDALWSISEDIKPRPTKNKS